MKALNKEAENRSMTTEEDTKWSKMKSEMDELDSDIKRAEFHASEEKRNAEIEGNQQESKKVDVEARAAFENYTRRGESGLSQDERRALEQRASTDPNTTANGDGGYTVPEFWAAVIEKVMKHYGGVLGVATVIPRQSGAPYNHPVIDDTNNVGAIIGEGATDVVNKFTDTTIPILTYTYTSRIIKQSIELIQDTGYPLTKIVVDMCAERIGRILNTHLTVGDGSSKPYGIVTGSTLGNTAAAVAAITRAELIDLKYSVDAAYRGPNSRFMMNDTTVAAIQKLDIGSSDARPLWTPSMREGAPDRILGSAYVENNDMAELGAGNKAIIYGDMSKYIINQVRTPELVTFKEKYMDERCYGYNMFARFGGRLVNTGAVKHLICAAS